MLHRYTKYVLIGTIIRQLFEYYSNMRPHYSIFENFNYSNIYPPLHGIPSEVEYQLERGCCCCCCLGCSCCRRRIAKLHCSTKQRAGKAKFSEFFLLQYRNLSKITGPAQAENYFPYTAFLRHLQWIEPLKGAYWYTHMQKSAQFWHLGPQERPTHLCTKQYIHNGRASRSSWWPAWALCSAGPPSSSTVCSKGRAVWCQP